MITAHFYDALTGRFIGHRFDGPNKALIANTPSGCRAYFPQSGEVIDPLSQCVDLETGKVIDYQPPRPADTEMETWLWIDRRWIAQPTEAALWRDVRSERDRRLAATDWRVVVATERGEAVPAEWVAYRQALRDITTQADPLAIIWPTAPE